MARHTPSRSIDRSMFSACFGRARDERALDDALDDDDDDGGRRRRRGGREASSSSSSKASTRRWGDDDGGRRGGGARSRFPAPSGGAAAGRADGTSASESGTPSEGEDEGSMRGCDFGLSRTTWRANVGNGVDANAALRAWLKRREMWRNVGNRSGRRRGGGAHGDRGATATTTMSHVSLTSLSSSSRRYGVSKRQGIPNGASYDSFLANRPASKAFKQPIALPDMVDFLNQCWAEGDGL